MSDNTRREGVNRLGRTALGERLAGFVYGTIVVLSVLVAGARAYPHEAGKIAALVIVTNVVFWLAHVYAHGLAQSVGRDERLRLPALLGMARREAAIVEAAVPPVAALLLGAVGVVSTSASVWIAFGFGLAVLAVEGVMFARVERLSWVGTVGVVAANLGLGFLLVGLKLLVTH
jgi:hypothetical protein